MTAFELAYNLTRKPESLLSCFAHLPPTSVPMFESLAYTQWKPSVHSLEIRRAPWVTYRIYLRTCWLLPANRRHAFMMVLSEPPGSWLLGWKTSFLPCPLLRLLPGDDASCRATAFEPMRNLTKTTFPRMSRPAHHPVT